MARNKEAHVWLLDVGPYMKGSLDLVCRSLFNTLEAKILHKPSHEVAIVLFGTTGTENALNRELGEDQYRHVSVAYPLACPDLGCLALLDRLPSEGPQAGNPDWLDALLVGLDMLARAEAAQGEIKGALVKRVTLISNFVRAVADIPDDQRDQLVTTMQNAGYSLEAVAVGEGRQLAADGFRLADRQANLDMLDRLLAEVRGELRLAEGPAELLGLFSAREVAFQTQFRDMMTLGPGCEVKVRVFKKTAATKPPALKPYSDLPIGEFLGEPTHEVRVNREYYLGSAGGPGVNDSGVVQPELLIRAHRYGKQHVPITAEDLREQSYSEARTFQLVGFLPRDQVPRHWYVGDSDIVVPEESGKDPRHAAGLSALVRGMERRNVVAIVRVNLKKGPKLHLGVLAPRLGSASRPDTAILNALPFAEDFRHYSFPSLLPADLPPAKRPDKSQFDAALRLVAAMDLGGGGNGGGAGSSGGVTKELLKPEATPNPALQRFLYVIGQRALHPGAPVAEADPLVEAVLEPPLARLPPEAAEALKAAAAKLRTEAVQAPAGAAGAAAAAAGPIGAPPAAEGAARPSAAAAGGVGTADPVQDFRQMVSAGRVDEAVPQLADVVPRILDSSPGDALHGKAMACVQTLRDVCLKHGKATAFNALLRSLAVRYAGDPLHGSFLQRLAEDGVTLISRSDSAQSDATALEAEEWLQQQLAGDDGAAAAMATSAPLAAAAAQPPQQQQQQGLQAAADAEMEDEFADME